MAATTPTLLIDFGTSTAAAMLVTDQGAWLVPDPASGEARWPCSIHWDGQRMIAGAAAVMRSQVDPDGFSTDIHRALRRDQPVQVGFRWLRPVEQVAEFFAVLRSVAQHLPGASGQYQSGASAQFQSGASAQFQSGASAQYPPGAAESGSIERMVVTVPASLASTDPLRSQLVGAGEAAGFAAVELVPGPLTAIWAPGSPVRAGDTTLVYDLGATFDAALIRVGEEQPTVLGHTRIEDVPADPGAAVDLTLAASRDLLGRLGIDRSQVAWVLPVGDTARGAGLAAAIESGLGIAVAPLPEPELAVVRGAATWLMRSGPRTLPARASGQRMVPLAFTIPGDRARLLRWLVQPRQRFDQGEAVARIRVAGGAIWELTARTAGTMSEVLVPAGQDVRSGDWIALVRPAS